MLRQKLTAWAAVVAGWLALGAWQYHEYRHEREAAQDTLRLQGEAVMNVLVGGIRSHRRLGPFFERQVQGVLEELVKSKGVPAAAIANRSGDLLLFAGRAESLELSSRAEPGESWKTEGFCVVEGFQLTPEAEDAEPGGGLGGGRGWGRGPRWQAETDATSAFAAGEHYLAAILLDRTRADEQCQHAAWSRGSVAIASGLVLICVALVWLATVRLAEAKGVFEAESRHLRELNQAAAGLAHETRNPLGLIRGWAQRLAEASAGKGGEGKGVGTLLCEAPEGPFRQKGPDPSVADPFSVAQSLVEECDRVTSRINQFLSFARPHEPKIESIDAVNVVEELAVLLEPDRDAKQLTLQRSLAATCGPIAADREMFRQALFNLIQNAVQWSPEGGTVEIVLQRGRAGRHRIEVADRGPGVPADAVSRLFSPYFTTRPKGTGLGLALVRRIAAAHGWEVGYTPRLGGGAIFWVDRIHG
jgi:signal transduction histidine kinase